MITVRQLESLVRLSEALAKMNNDVWVRKEYVAEAVRLLRDSITRIEKDDIIVEDYQTLPNSAFPIDNPQPKVERLPYEEYKAIQRNIIQYIRTREAIFQPAEDSAFSVRQ